MTKKLQNQNKCPVIWESPESKQGFKDLLKVRCGKTAQKLILAVDRGMNREQFDGWKKKHDFDGALAAIRHFADETTEQTLRDFALFRYYFETRKNEIPWEIMLETFPCMSGSITAKGCPECPKPCGCSRSKISILRNIVKSDHYRRQPGGFYADRLMTALAFDVPLERIEKSRLINIPVALKAMCKSRDWLNGMEVGRLERIMEDAREAAERFVEKIKKPAVTPSKG